MSNYILHQTPITYETKRDKRRKTLLLTLHKNCVTITAPTRLNNKQAILILEEKAAWILKTIHAAAAASPPSCKTAGINIPFLGTNKTLQFQVSTKNLLTITPDALILYHNQPLDDTAVHRILKKWFQETAKKILIGKTNIWSTKIGVYPQRIFIKEQKTRWGSCSTLGNINYNWRIIMAPEHIIDYLIVHELCHLHHMNHSKNFWQLVQNFIPDYKECRQWLKINGQNLTLC